MSHFIAMIYFVDVNECEEFTPCDMNAFCSNTDGSFECNCPKGYSRNGTSCEGT